MPAQMPWLWRKKRRPGVEVVPPVVRRSRRRRRPLPPNAAVTVSVTTTVGVAVTEQPSQTTNTTVGVAVTATLKEIYVRVTTKVVVSSHFTAQTGALASGRYRG